MSERAEQWNERYRAGMTGWDRGEPSAALFHWLDKGTIEPCRILVPGCGNGHEVVELARRDFDVTGVDIADVPVQHLRERLAVAGLNAQVIQTDLLLWQPPQRFDAIYEQTALCALHPSLWPEYAHRLTTWLKPRGRLLALFMQTGHDGGPPYHCSPARMRELFSAPLWSWPKAPAFRVAHPSGLEEIGYVITRNGGRRSVRG